MKKAIFITFEGIEGCGKTTQAKLLYEWFINNGIETVLTREPGGTPTAEEIREFILSEKDEPFPKEAELLLYMAARSFHTTNLIKPSLKNNINIICDRFIDATIAYQGYGRDIDLKLIKKLNDFAIKGLKPNITFLIDVPVEVGLQRIAERKKDRMEKENIEFHRKVRKGYLKIAEKEPNRVVIIDGKDEQTAIHRNILKVIEETLNAL